MNKPIPYSDNTFITAGQYGIQIDFGQSVGSTNQVEVVERLGMSYETARILLELLRKEIAKDEN